jgi:DNA-binding MarR family transcriptional regulator
MSKFFTDHEPYRALFHSGMAQRHHDLLQRFFGEGDTSSMMVFRSLLRVASLINAISEKALDPHGLSLAKVRLLIILMLRDEEGLLPSEVSKLQGVMPNTISSLVASLRDAGLIEQAAHPSDKRKHIIKIAPPGREVLQNIAPLQHTFVRALFEDFTDHELQSLGELVGKLTDRVQRMMETPDTDTKAASPPP